MPSPLVWADSTGRVGGMRSAHPTPNTNFNIVAGIFKISINLAFGMANQVFLKL